LSLGSAPRPSASPGLLASLRALFHSSLAMLQVRLDLLTADAELAARRLLEGLVLALLGLFGLAVCLLLALALLVLAVDPEWRLHLLALLTLLFLIGGGLALMAARQAIRRLAASFDASRGELARDLDALLGRPERPLGPPGV